MATTTDTMNTGRKRKAAPKTTTPPLYIASVVQTADNTYIRVKSPTAHTNDNVVLRIKKCLGLAKDSGATESEVKAALQLAHKLMSKLNITQAEVLAHESPEDRQNHAGHSRVAIRRRDGNREKLVTQACYLADLCRAMECYFQCKTYTTSGRTAFKITFYGIADNTVAAAEAFEMVYNLMVEWARPYKGLRGKNSYCRGVCKELLKTAERERDEEEAQAKTMEEEQMAVRVRREEAERQAQLDRLVDLPEDSAGSVNLADRCTERSEPSYTDRAQRIVSLAESSGAESDEDEQWPEWNGFSDDEDEAQAIRSDDMHADFYESDSDDSTDVGGYDNEVDGITGNNDFVADDIKAQIVSLVAAMRPTASPSQERQFVPDPVPNVISSASGDQTALPNLQTNAGGGSQLVPTAATGDTPNPSADEERVGWASHMQLVQFRHAADEIADDYLKREDIKLKKGRTRYFSEPDPEAFDDGVRDSRKMDVRRKTIELADV